tara:strand:+ start:134 stop:1603 length:1470 start_codon:yes stop_codon:yes gene_type:complete
MAQFTIDNSGNIVPSNITVRNVDTGLFEKNIPTVSLAQDQGMSRMMNAFNKPTGNFSALAQRPNRFSSLGQQMNAQGLMPQQQRTMTPGFSSLGQQMNAQGLMSSGMQSTPSTTSRASTIGKGLLDFAQSPYGEGFATGLLKAGGFSPRPISFAEALGTAMEQGQKSRADAQKFAFEKEKFDFSKTQANIENLLAEAKIGVELQKVLKPKLSNAAIKLMDFGIDPNSPEGRAYLMAELDSGKTTINLNDKQNFKFNETFFNETLIPKSNELQEKVTENQELKSVYQQMKILLDSDLNTGVFDEAFLGIKRFLRDAGVLTEKQAERVTTQELFQKLSNFTVPRMRVPGSGATSDFEANLFRTATLTLGDDENTNKIIVSSRLAALNLQQEYADFYSEFTSRFDADSKKSDFSNRKIGDAFRLYLDQNPDVLANLVGLDTNNIISNEDDLSAKIKNGTLNVGDMIFSNDADDNAYNTFTILNEEIINNYKE